MRHLIPLLAVVTGVKPVGSGPGGPGTVARRVRASRWAPVQPGAVAVVPFENISATPGDDWIGAGIAETLSADLERLDAVSVVGREGLAAEARALGAGMASSAAGDAERWMREVSRRRGAAWLVTGGYQRLGARVRITARLVDTETGTLVAGAKADGTAEEIFALQDRIGDELTGALVSLAAADGTAGRTARARARPGSAATETATATAAYGGTGTAMAMATVAFSRRAAMPAAAVVSAARAPPGARWRRTSTARSPWAARP